MEGTNNSFQLKVFLAMLHPAPTRLLPLSLRAPKDADWALADRNALQPILIGLPARVPGGA